MGDNGYIRIMVQDCLFLFLEKNGVKFQTATYDDSKKKYGRCYMRLCDLREKEVINVCDGERLGNVCDIDFDVKTGRICALIIPGPCKIFGILGRDHEYIIPYSDVQRIGSDVILVEVDMEKCLHKCEWN